MAQAEAARGVCAALAAGVPEWRRGRVRHSREALVRQRVFQIACGYQDQHDASLLRADPLFQLAWGRLPASEPELASQPTLSGLENAVDRHAVELLATRLAELYLREPGRDGCRPGWCWTGMEPTTRPTASRRESPSRATTASTCTSRGWSLMARPGT